MTAPEAHSIPVLAFHEAAVRMGDRSVWRDVTMQVDEGQFVSILGPNGVGKTTMLKAVLGLTPLAAGTIQVFGRPAGQTNHEIAYLPQRRSYDAELRVRGIDVVRLGLDGTRWGVPIPGAGRFSRRTRREADVVAEVLHVVGAEGYASRPIGELSGGEQQRLLIAQALASHPRLLLLDEPLDSLDLPNQDAIAALIARICRTRGVTVVMVAHDVNPMLTYLDRVIYLARGSALIGKPDAVITSRTLTRLYNAPVEVLRASDGRLVVLGQPEAPALHSDRHAT